MPIVDRAAKYCDAGIFINHSREITTPSQVVGDNIMDGVQDNFGPDVASDVISGVAVVKVGTQHRCP